MRKRLMARFSRRAALLALAGGLIAAGVAGVGLAAITTSSSPGDPTVSTATTQSSTTGNQTTSTFKGEDADDQENENVRPDALGASRARLLAAVSAGGRQCCRTSRGAKSFPLRRESGSSRGSVAAGRPVSSGGQR